MVRLHLRAAFAWGVVAAALGAIGWAALVDPTLTAGVPWLGTGRVRFASGLAMLLGWNVNLAAAVLYFLMPGLDAWVRRVRLDAVKVGGWNLVIVAPAVACALAGIVPPAPVDGFWTPLAVAQPQVFALGLVLAVVFVQTIDPSVWRDGRRTGIIVATIAFAGLTILPPLDSARQIRALIAGQPFVDALAGRLPFWTGTLVATLFFGWASALFLARPPVATSSAGPMWMRRAGLTLLLVALVVQTVSAGLAQVTGDHGPALSAAEQRGRVVFAREGCASCHDVPWRAGIGPTLFEESGARPADWHFTHLHDPRSIQLRSVMPSYAHLFDGDPASPRQDARDLVAFLDSLGREPLLAMSEATVLASQKTRARHPVAIDPAPALPFAGDLDAAKKQFAVQCMGCHGPEGQGDGRAAAGLRPRPANLAAHRYTPEQVARVLWNGVPGTAMPAWRDQPAERLAALAAAARSFGDAAASHAAVAPPSDDTLALGAKVFSANCAQCHGETGGGDGFSASRLAVPPANFQGQQPTLDYALRAIAGGVEGTPMAPWTTRISEQELLAVAHYVRSLYKGER
jgi:cytochrome c oxidase cbb3-type subunit 2